jgi:hypothetical protein
MLRDGRAALGLLIIVLVAIILYPVWVTLRDALF